jgi:glutathione S-transferase
VTLQLIIGNKNYSSWSLRAWLLLSEAGIEFDEVRIPLDEPDTRERLLAVSPAGRVPVLKAGSETIWDSLAIAETVAERWPDAGLWPDDPAERARARVISAEMHSGFAALREAMPMNCRAMGRKVAMTDALAADIERIFDIWTDCGGDGWLFDRFSVADAMYAPVVMRFRTYGVDVPEAAFAYPKRLLESRAMQDWLVAAESETEVIEREELGH